METADRAPRFAATSCSNCGSYFGPGDQGFSHCENHAGRAEASLIAADLAYNSDKDAGGPARRNHERAMALQMRQPQTNEGFFV